MTMVDDGEGSITGWIVGVRSGVPGSAEPLWDQYFSRLVGLARTQMRLIGGRGRDAGGDEEDAALSAFRSLFKGLVGGQYPLLADRHDLWRMLVVITTRKVATQARRRLRKKRGGGSVKTVSDVNADAGTDADILARAISSEPTPEFALMVAEEYRKLLGRLGDETFRQVVILRMEGYTVEEIAVLLECSSRTVARQLTLIRRVLSSSVEGE